MHARYISKRFGGVEIAWRTHGGNFPRWHEIDAQIWKFIEAWNVANFRSLQRRHTELGASKQGPLVIKSDAENSS
jgi:hypothetical protein